MTTAREELSILGPEGEVLMPPAPGPQRRPWATGLTLAVLAAAFAVAVARGTDPVDPTPEQLIEAGGRWGFALARGEWWRLATAALLHAGVVHLLMNAWALWDGGRVAERLFGTAGFAAIYVASGLGGGLAGAMVSPMTVSVGASGAIFGLFGAIVAHTLAVRGDARAAFQPLRRSVLGFLAYNVLYGAIVPEIGLAAHLGGVCTGFVAGRVLSGAPPGQRGHGRALVLAAGVTVLLAVAGVPALAARLRTIPAVRNDETSRRAFAAWIAGDLARARATFTDLLASERTARVLFSRGQVTAEMGDGRAALADFDAALALEPGPSWELRLCEVASDEEAVGAALGDRGLAACERAVAGNPQSPRAYLGRGWVHADRREYEAALRDLDRGLELRPGDEVGRAKRVWVLARLDRLEDADRECDALHRSPPVGAPIVSTCTDVAIRRGDIVKARARLDAPGAEGLDPKRRQELEERIARRSAATGTR